MISKPPKYWIAVVSRDHVLEGVQGGFAQAGHGKAAPLKKMKEGDWLVYYSPKTSMNGGEKCQRFTAIGKIKDNWIYQVEVSKDFVPNRRDVDYVKSCEVSIIPLVERLSFIEDKNNWGYKFRLGVIEISQNDFDIISREMLGNETESLSA